MANALNGLGFLNTSDLNAIGEAFFETFDDEAKDAGLDAEELIDHFGAEWPEDADGDDWGRYLDLDDYFLKHEAGASLVKELASQGFKIVRR